MTTTTRNEAADRLLERIRQIGSSRYGWHVLADGWSAVDASVDIDAIKAAERRATVERIREAVRNAPRDEGPPVDRGSRFMVEVYRILDEEAQRSQGSEE